ncbi:protein tramtrack, alpha isoform-like isoform X2 [Chrysoperla carnea]|uniref:protein tramtrack, alpha isoform-like isoform X2 n=1 Tax=Chrysoperla carnea TaxID=189513 RepID=UPI001D088FD0|nr:protein tramtrack, alpha isoform-like isoform X2 [Chrysoperla carnea]
MSIDAQSRYHRYNSQQQTHGSNNMPVVQPQQQQSGSNNSAPIMSSSQRFCLRWNNHQSNLLSVFDQLLQDESFVDVTLAVEGQLLRAHKMVLSACSPYFQALFVSHPDKHPIVILKDVPYIDMRSLLDFMYRGEVSVDQDRLTAFLRVAESLRIKGLTEVNEDKCDLPSITSSLLGSGGNVNSNSYHQRSLPSKRPSAGLSTSGNMSGNMGAVGSMGSQAMSPLLGNALAQPKRKRGRPRKFSGSSNGTPSLDGDDDGDSPILRGTPELLEVKMNVDGFQGSGNEMRSETDAEGDDADAEDPLGDSSIVKEETQVQDQPMVGTSREQDNYSNNEEYHSESPSIRNIMNTAINNKFNQKQIIKSEPNDHQQQQQQQHHLFLQHATSASLESALSHYQILINQQNSQQQSDNINNNNLNIVTSMASTSGAATPGGGGTMITTTPGVGNNNTQLSAPSGRQPVRRRNRRRATSASQDPAEQLTEMSVRGLNLFRYASVSEGIYQCTECAKVDVQKTFKNKYSFQRHAFLYHEGHQRKVFPCPVCQKEFSRPDKMKNHMKTVHDCFMPKECVFPQTPNFYLNPPNV